MVKVEPYPRKCPSFEKCSVNRCPIDLATPERVILPDDPETRCRAKISTRRKIATQYSLPNKGMTERELKREKRSKEKKAWWNALPEEEKRRRVANLKPRRKMAV